MREAWQIGKLGLAAGHPPQCVRSSVTLALVPINPSTSPPSTSYIFYPSSQLGQCPESPRHGSHTALHTVQLSPSRRPHSPWGRPLSWHGVAGACWAWAPPELLEQGAGELFHPAPTPGPCFCVRWSPCPQLSESRPAAHWSRYIHVLCCVCVIQQSLQCLVQGRGVCLPAFLTRLRIVPGRDRC